MVSRSRPAFSSRFLSSLFVENTAGNKAVFYNYLTLTPELRIELKTPLGKLCQSEELPSLIANRKPLIIIGDYSEKVALMLPELTECLSLSVVDGRTKRTDFITEESEYTRKPNRTLIATSPPAYLSLELVNLLDRYFSLKDFSEWTRVFVRGEEDLATLPVMWLMPAGSALIYGQPGEGAVVVYGGRTAKQKARYFLSCMRRSNDVG
ncbi:MAG: DUF359 domain-containing protein [Thermoplasmata archaeon]